MKAIVFAHNNSQELSQDASASMSILCGITLLERHLRTLKQYRINSAFVVLPSKYTLPDRFLKQIEKLGLAIEMIGADNISTLEHAMEEDQHVLVMAGDYVIERFLFKHLLAAPTNTVLVDSTPPEFAKSGTSLFSSKSFSGQMGSDGEILFAGAAVLDRSVSIELIRQLSTNGSGLTASLNYALGQSEGVRQMDITDQPTLNPEIRRYRRSVWMRITKPQDLHTAKQHLIDGAQKGSLDWPAQVVHAPIENWIVGRLCESSITPNQLTVLTNLVAWTVTWLLFTGHIIVGLACAAVVGVLDGLDGKLARVKVMTSHIGKLEHVADLIFEYSWWFALGWALSHGDTSSSVFIATIFLVLGTLGDTTVSLAFLYFRGGLKSGRTLDNFTRLDYVIRKFSGRRNIFIWILLVISILSDPITALYVTAAWSVLTFIVRGFRAAVHLISCSAPKPGENFMR